MIIDAIISGAQTGADWGCTLAAQELGLGTGGYTPKDYCVEGGFRDSKLMESLNFIATEVEDYGFRTMSNVRLADATVIFGKRSPGSNRAEELCRVTGKPCCWVQWQEGNGCKGTLAIINPARTFVIDCKNYRAFRLWLLRNKVKILNGAGNRESVNHGIEQFAKSFIIKALTA